MIDTDKYEGHTPGPWEVRTHYDTTCVCYSKDDDSECSFVKIHEEHENEEDAQLIADAPLLLQEVKRLRWGIYFALSYTEPTPHTDDPWMACREFIVEYLESLIAGIRPLSFIPKGDEEE